MDSDDRDTASPSHQRAPFADPLADGIDPTSPGAPHEPGGTDYRQSEDGKQASETEVPTATPGLNPDAPEAPPRQA